MSAEQLTAAYPVDVLWRVHSYGVDHHGPGEGGYLHNRPRRPRGMVVVQYVLAGSMRFVESRRSHDVAPNRAAIFAYGERSSYGLAGDATEPCHSMWATLQGRGLHEHSRALREQGRSILDDRGDGGWRRR